MKIRAVSNTLKKISGQTVILIGVTVLLLLLGTVINHQFLSPANIANILIMSSLLGMVAAGQTLVVISGGDGLDLSVGGVMSIGAVVSYIYMDGSNRNIVAALMIVLLIGAFIGFLNALGIVFARIPALVMTLAMSNVLTSVQQLITGGNPTGAPAPLAVKAATGKLLPFLPGMVVLWIFIIAVVQLILTRAAYGKQLYAVGTNSNAAFLSGVRIRGIRILTYSLCGVLSAFAGFWLCSYNGVVYVNAGASYVMPSVAAVVIGGTSIAGGKGSYTGTAAGAVILTLITNLLVMANTDEAGRFMMNGVILMALLIVYTRQSKIRQ